MAAKKVKLKKEKKVLVFDENSRREYLLGFRKRKNERRRKAQEDLMKKEKERRKELKLEKKRGMVEQMEKQRKELEALEADFEGENQDIPSLDTMFDHPEHVVTVTTINDVNLDSGRFARIGPNRGLVETAPSKVSSDTSPSEKLNSSVKGTDITTPKARRFHKKLRKKRSRRRNEHEQDGQLEKNKKRKHIHSGLRGKSKHSKKS